MLDTNDNTPEFQGQASVNVREDTSAGTDILTFTATDRDAGLNGTVLYEIISGNEQGKKEIQLIQSHPSLLVRFWKLLAPASTQCPP